MKGILEGIRVVEMGHVIAVPAAGVTFADWGAEVIKVEPLSGELMRGWARTAGGVSSDTVLLRGGKLEFPATQ